MTIIDQIINEVAEICIPYFFIVTEFSMIANEMPKHLEPFLRLKHEAILQGARSRKFVYQEESWRIIFTFFPTDRVVEERYALKNKVLKKR